MLGDRTEFQEEELEIEFGIRRKSAASGHNQEEDSLMNYSLLKT